MINEGRFLPEMEEVRDIRALLLDGMVIPAHPLALTRERKLDERRQRALSRYYLASGAGGLAVGVHTTQFRIHDPDVNLYRPVLELAAEEIARFESGHDRRIVRVAGIVGRTDHALREASLAKDLGYDIALLSLSAFEHDATDVFIEHCRRVGEIIPLFGFYLQPAIGGRILKYDFWRSFLELDCVAAIKVAPFNRYKTLDVVRAVADAGRENDVALYTGNDDAIVHDLLSVWSFGEKRLRMAGGLLGQWAIWTRNAVSLLERIRDLHIYRQDVPRDLLETATALTDVNAAIFDAGNGFAGAIPGIHEVLRRQGLLEGNWCLDQNETLSRGQQEDIDRILQLYPHFNDNAFITQHLEDWLS